MKRLLARSLVLTLAAFGLTGCSHYITPGAKADLQAFAPASIQEGFAAKPTHPFPASIAAIRVQESNYTNYYLRQNGGSYGNGRYSVIMTREVETQAQFDRIAELPQVSGLVTLNRMLLPETLTGDRELREAAARLHADLLFIYTFDTAFYNGDPSVPLTVITLGLSPTRKITATTTASALLMDTRSGYIYSAYEVTDKATIRSTAWGSRNSPDAVRRKTEGTAFDKLINEVVASWPKLLAK